MEVAVTKALKPDLRREFIFQQALCKEISCLNATTVVPGEDISVDSLTSSTILSTTNNKNTTTMMKMKKKKPYLFPLSHRITKKMITTPIPPVFPTIPFSPPN
ncbi:hypothetical protein RJT34_01166 [Clitoria ternatea]|uniref:Uncharacterized protein n=1 Tax=Clitoria ternatea TaxID=43366 RepID=A0AAN9KG03_CLITE